MMYLCLLERKNVLTTSCKNSLVYCAYYIDIAVISLSQHLLWQYCMSSNSLCKGRGFSKPANLIPTIERMKDIQLIVSVQFDYNTLRQFQAVYVFDIVLLYWHTGEIISC